MLLLFLFIGLPIVGLIIGLHIKNKAVSRLCASLLCLEGSAAGFVFMETWALMSASSGFYFYAETMTFWPALILCGALFGICLICIWKPFREKSRKIAILLLALTPVILAGFAIGVSVYDNGITQIPDGDTEIDLRRYAPFGERTLAASLDEPPALTFTENIPRIDGATALYPLYSAFARATYPEGNYDVYSDLSVYGLTFDEYVKMYDIALTENIIEKVREEHARLSPVICSQTDGAFENLFSGAADIIFVMDISDARREEADNLGLTLTLTPIGREAFVFLVNSRNKISDLRRDEVRAIYSGEITDWSGIGDGSIKGAIKAYQRKEGSGSQTALQKLMGETPIAEPEYDRVFSFMGGMYNAVADYKNYKNSIGYSFRFYIESMMNDETLKNVKLLSIDGVAPTIRNIADGTYPFSDDFYAVRVERSEYDDEKQRLRAENAQKLINWILSPQGRELTEKTGYAAPAEFEE
jgi:phosphate transport system substrate-binding protein